MKTSAFVLSFLITIVAIVTIFFVAVAVIGVSKGMSTGEVLRAIGDASIFTKEFWTNTGISLAMPISYIGGIL